MVDNAVGRLHWRGFLADAAWIAGLFLVFAGVVWWFNVVDFYQRHFFDEGLIVVANHVVRIGFLFILIWLVYAPGAAVAAMLLRGQASDTHLTPAERGILAFGFGMALWHVFMLVLGVAGLYYRPVMVAVAAAVLLTSCRHFATVARAACALLSNRLGQLRRGEARSDTAVIGLVVLCAVWLLVVRGLYPGGGGDYYTHYFYYTVEVLKNHGLAPNDVWYHYYYSKGYGLTFLGMLLTDPEAPALVTFGCMLFAAAALATLAARLAPRSLWPACVAGLYLLFYLICISSRGSGELQKGHERVTALMILIAFGLCMAHRGLPRVWTAMAAACGVAIAVIAQPFGVIVAFYFGVAWFWSLLRRQKAAMWRFFFAAAAVGVTVLGVLVLSYVQTGLPNDQALDLMLRFADVKLLDEWGVLPQIVLVAWIRDNYLIGAKQWDLSVLEMLKYFLRLDHLWVYLTGPFVLLVVLAARMLSSKRIAASTTQAAATFKRFDVVVIGVFGSLILVLAAVSLLVARGQSGSFERASTFFFALLLMLGMAASSFLMAQWPGERARTVMRWHLPALLMGGTLLLWIGADSWAERVGRATANGVRYLTGNYSLREAYAHIEDGGLPFGGINPQALVASRQVGPGTPIWALTIDAYCMVPGCWMESVVSFKMSGKLDEIVTGSPERSRDLLREAGLDYFLVIEDTILLDLLPYSALFRPNTIGEYLGIKWTDGTAFLLTWIGPETTPITSDFLEIYTQLLRKREHPWFRFSKLAPQMTVATESLRNKVWGAPPDFPWRRPPPDGTINVLDATFGRSCRSHIPKNRNATNKVSNGNATEFVRDECSAKTTCEFTIDLNIIADPANGCEKDFEVIYKCALKDQPKTLTIPPPADDATLRLDCPTN